MKSKPCFSRMATLLASLVVCFGAAADGQTAVWTNVATGGASWYNAGNWQDGVLPSTGGEVAFPNPTYLLRQQHSDSMIALCCAIFDGGTSLSLSGISGLDRYAVALQGMVEANSSPTELSVRDPSGFAGVFRPYIDARRGTPTLSLAAQPGHVPTVNHIDSRLNIAVKVPDAGSEAEVLDVVGDGELVKTGDGMLSAAIHNGVDGRVAVLAGTLELRAPQEDAEPALPADPYFHIDASAASTMTFADVGGERRVTRIADASGGAVAAEPFAAYPGPTVVSNAVNGLPVLDFGGLGTSATLPTDEVSVKYGRPAALVWTEQPSNVREVFIVWRNKRVRSIPFPLGTRAGWPFAVHVDLLERNRLRIDDSWCSPNILSGDQRLNDAPMYPGESFESTVFNVWSFGLSGDTPLNTFALDREGAYRIGGIQLAEAVIYTRALTPRERTAVNRYLMHKWLAGPYAAPADVAAARVAENGTVKVRAGEEVSVRQVSAQDGVLVKSGGGTLLVGTISGAAAGAGFADAAVRVLGGAIGTLPPIAPSGSNTHHAAALHLDASAEGSFTFSGGDGISEWHDARANVDMAATASAFYRPPRLVANALNGKPVVDLGAYHEVSVQPKSETESAYDDSGWLSFQNVQVREGFLVLRDKEIGRRIFMLGHKTEYKFHRGNNGRLIDGRNADGFAVRGAWRVDGVPVDPISHALDDSFHLVSFSLQCAIPANTLGWDRGYRCGGQEIAEVILYSEPLSPAERQAIEAQLMEKWLNAGHPLSRPASFAALRYDDGAANTFVTGGDAYAGIASGSGVLSKLGAGTLSLGALCGFSGVDVQEGALEVSGSNGPKIMEDAFFHVDPSDESTITRDSAGNVAAIADVRRNGRFASMPNTVPRAPSTVPDGANSLNVMDFGAYYYNGNGVTLPASVGQDCAALKWNETISNAHSVFVVFADTAAKKDMPIIGSMGHYHLNRGGDAGGALVDTSWAHPPLRGGKCEFYIDGVSASPTETPIPDGLHVLSLVVDQDQTGVTLDMFGEDRLFRWGGVRIGEMAVFERSLSRTERETMEEYLKAKWMERGEMSFLSTADGTFSIGNGLRLAAGAKIGARWAAGGSAPVEVAGILALAEEATVELEAAPGHAPQPGKMNLFAATAISNAEALRTWKLTGPLADRFRSRFKAEGGSLWLELFPRGNVVIIR